MYYLLPMLKHTALHSWHTAAGARLAEFAGWQMPIQYTEGAIAEHHLVRRSMGVFDVSHMARFSVTGPAATAWLNSMVTADTSAVAKHGSTYALLCKPDGGVVDDLFLYRLADQWLIVANAANEEKDFAWLEDHLPDEGVDIRNSSESFAMFAVQGPNAVTVIDELCDGAATATERFFATQVSLAGVELTLGRTGYTGEDGVELFVPNGQAQRVWTAILDQAKIRGVEAGPVGLAARDSLRFEPGFPLYGHELTEEITPVEARLTWACAFQTPFIGRDAILERKKTGAQKRLATIRMVDRGVPRQGCHVIADGQTVGHVVSGMYAPTVDSYCANVFLLPHLAKSGTVVEVDIRGNKKRAEVVKRPLYTPAYR